MKYNRTCHKAIGCTEEILHNNTNCFDKQVVEIEIYETL